MQSPDWPDLPFVRPAAYGTGRDGQRAMFSVIHYTAGSERSTSAEDGASFDARRTDGTSTHYFHDSDSTVQCVRLADRANACFHHGNRLGIQHELCGTQQTRAQWLDPASRATIRRTAAQIVRDHTRLGIPLRRLTPAQVRACWNSGDRSIGGICGHVDVTRAFPEDGGTHEDPGTAFPWDVLFADIEDIRNGGDDDMDLNEVGGIVPGITNGQALHDIWTWAATARGLAPVGPDGAPGARTDDRFQDATAPGQVVEALRALSTPALSAEHLDALADKVAAKLGALRFVADSAP